MSTLQRRRLAKCYEIYGIGDSEQARKMHVAQLKQRGCDVFRHVSNYSISSGHQTLQTTGWVSEPMTDSAEQSYKADIEGIFYEPTT